MPKTDNEKLEALKKREAQLKAKISAIEAQAAARARKEDTRLKVLVGAALLADAKLHPATAEFIRATLARALSAQRDRDFLQAKGWIAESGSAQKQP